MIKKMKSNIPNNVLSFWTDYYKEDYKEIEDKWIPVYWASKKAYLDLNRTLTFRDKINDSTNKKEIIKKREDWRKNVAKNICKQLEKTIASKIENKEAFNKWHYETCEAIIDVYSFEKKDENKSILIKREKKKKQEKKEPRELSYGQAQKWLNMTIKYLWLLKKMNMLNDELSDFFIDDNARHFHVPLDSYILKYAGGINKENKDFDFQERGLSAPVKFDKLPNHDWSNIDKDMKEKYEDYQEKIKINIDGYDNIPLEWELEHWHKAIEFYGE